MLQRRFTSGLLLCHHCFALRSRSFYSLLVLPIYDTFLLVHTISNYECSMFIDLQIPITANNAFTLFELFQFWNDVLEVSEKKLQPFIFR
jgi:hypothetical protein